MKVRSFWPPLATLLGGLVLLVLLAEPPARRARGPHEEPLLPRQDVLRLVGRGYLQLMADYFWIQLAQTTGRANNAAEYRDVFPYANLITDLDPMFQIVYGFAAGVIPTNLGRETWVNTAESTRLLRKGLALFPDDLKLNMLLAYNLSAYDRDYTQAAAVAEKASKLPGAPSYLSALATRLYAQSGQVDAGLALAQSLLDSAEDDATRETFKQRVQDLKMERELRRVDAAIDRFRQTFGTVPPNVRTLQWLGYLRVPPRDPKGGGFFIGSDGRTYSVTQQRRLELFTPDQRGMNFLMPALEEQ